ncbi:MAG: hypothetical protein MMC33_006757 [Icmadophila ericetorum]|nr:hypothetical protein [Icmadophila ericetorum]
MQALDLKQLIRTTGQKIYFHLNHPIQWIRLVGMVVAAEVISDFLWVITLDDSSGMNIEVVCRKSPTYLRLAKKKSENMELTSEETKTMLKESKMGITAQGTQIDMSEWDVGMAVKVKGGITAYKGERQVALEKITTVLTTNEEASAWAELQQFRTTVLSKPWMISAREERKMKDGIGGAAKRKREKTQRRQEQEKDKKRHDRDQKREPLKDKSREQVKSRVAVSPLTGDLAELKRKHKEARQEIKKNQDAPEVWL